MGSKVNTRDYVGSRMVMYTRRFNVSRWQSPDLAIAISPMQIITYSCLRKYTWRFNITEWQCADLHIAISTMQIYTGAKCWRCRSPDVAVGNLSEMLGQPICTR